MMLDNRAAGTAPPIRRSRYCANFNPAVSAVLYRRRRIGRAVT